jgi:hypothetical protein
MSINQQDILESVAKSVKLKINGQQQEKFFNSIEKMMELANKIQDIDTVAIEQELNMFFNFKYQNLQLLEEPIEEIEPTFYRSHLNNMIMVPKFVDKDA